MKQQSVKQPKLDNSKVFQAAFERAGDGLIVANISGTCLKVNHAAARLMGYPLPRLLEKSLFDIVPAPAKKKLRQIFRSKSGKMEIQIPMRNEFRFIELKTIPGFVPNKVLVSLRDISDRKKTQQLMQKQALLLDLAEDSIMIRGVDDNILYWNRGAERMYGWTKQEAVGQYVHTFLNTVFPAPFDEVKKKFLSEGYWYGLLKHTGRDGSKIIVDSRWTLDRDELGRPVCYMEINSNITEKRKAEEALKHAHDELELRVEERTGELLHSNKLLMQEIEERKRVEEELRSSEKRLRALSSQLMTAQEEERRRISRDLHDDLGQVLTSIALNLGRVIKSRKLESNRNLLSRIREQNEEARKKLRELSSILRPGVLDDVGLKEAIQTLVTEFQGETEIHASLELNFRNEEIPKDARTHLYRMLQECLTNISRHASAENVSIRMISAEKKVVLEVTDDGIGFHMDTVRPEKSIGLLGMRERAESLEGSLNVISEPGLGTRIEVVLPASVLPYKEVLSISGIRVLLADDHAMVRQGLTEVLQDSKGITVVAQADSGNTALRLAKETHPNVAVLDYSLPELDGVALIQQIRTACPKTRILVLTVHDNIHYALKAMESGAHGFLIKAAAADELVRAIRTIHQGRTYLSAGIAEGVAGRLSKGIAEKTGLELLSKREFELLRYLGSGRKLQDCARDMKITDSSASTYRTRMMQKLNLNSNAEIVRFAVDNGIVL